MLPGRNAKFRPSLNWGTPEEVARKILEEQISESFPASSTPVRKTRHPLRIAAGIGLAVLVLGCFLFQHSKATPVVPASSAVSVGTAPAASVPAASSAVLSEAPSDGLTFSLSADMVKDELSLDLDYGSVTFVTDPEATGITLQFDGFAAPYLTHSSKESGETTFTYHIPSYRTLPDPSSALLTITAPENALHHVSLDLAMGDVDLGALSIEELDLDLAMGDVTGTCLTANDAEFQLAMGDCRIDQLNLPDLEIEMALGDCTLGLVSDAEDIRITTTTGDITLTLAGSASDYQFITNGHEDTFLNEGKKHAARTVALNSTTGSFSIFYTNN